MIKPITGLTLTFNEYGDCSMSRQDWVSLQDQIYAYQKQIEELREALEEIAEFQSAGHVHNIASKALGESDE